MAVVGEDYFEGSDESSENELLDRSLSVWRGWQIQDEPVFEPVPLDTHTAASIGQYDWVWAIVQRSEEDINRKNEGGWTPLMYACYIGHDSIVSLLIDAGASVNAKNGKGQSPLMLAASCGNRSVAYCIIQAGADLEAKDRKGWTALFHATYSGHQNMVSFLLESHANPEAKDKTREFTPLMEAAAAGHEIIVQCFLQHGVNVNAKSCTADTARSLAMAAGHTKIVSLIDNHLLGPAPPLRNEPGLEKDLSSSDENYQHPRSRNPRQRSKRPTGPSIGEGPAALAKMFNKVKKQGGQTESNMVPSGYIQFGADGGALTGQNNNELLTLEMVSPIDSDDHSEPVQAGTAAFLKTGTQTIKSSTGSGTDNCEEFDTRSVQSDPGPPVLSAAPHHNPHHQQPHPSHPSLLPPHPSNPSPHPLPHRGLTQVHSDPQICPPHPSSDTKPRPLKVKQQPDTPFPMNAFPQFTRPDPSSPFTNAYQQVTYGQLPMGGLPTDRPPSQLRSSSQDASPAATETPSGGSGGGSGSGSGGGSSLSAAARKEQATMLESRPSELEEMLGSLGLSKYYPVFLEQDVDLQVFLTLNDAELKEVGIKLLGPRKKMINAIARWHLNARPAGGDLEQAYADKLMTEIQELNVQITQSSEQLEVAKHQVLQEQELRTVTEEALMEDRVAWQHVHSIATDSHVRFQQIKEILHNVSQYQAELSRRFGGGESPFSRSGSHGREGLAEALKDKLLLVQKEAGLIPTEVASLSTQQLLRRLAAWHNDLATLIAMVTLNMDRLLGREPSLPRQPRGAGGEFSDG